MIIRDTGNSIHKKIASVVIVVLGLASLAVWIYSRSKLVSRNKKISNGLNEEPQLNMPGRMYNAQGDLINTVVTNGYRDNATNMLATPQTIPIKLQIDVVVSVIPPGGSTSTTGAYRTSYEIAGPGNIPTIQNTPQYPVAPIYESPKKPTKNNEKSQNTGPANAIVYGPPKIPAIKLPEMEEPSNSDNNNSAFANARNFMETNFKPRIIAPVIKIEPKLVSVAPPVVQANISNEPISNEPNFNEYSSNKPFFNESYSDEINLEKPYLGKDSPVAKTEISTTNFAGLPPPPPPPGPLIDDSESANAAALKCKIALNTSSVNEGIHAAYAKRKVKALQKIIQKYDDHKGFLQKDPIYMNDICQQFSNVSNYYTNSTIKDVNLNHILSFLIFKDYFVAINDFKVVRAPSGTYNLSSHFKNVLDDFNGYLKAYDGTYNNNKTDELERFYEKIKNFSSCLNVECNKKSEVKQSNEDFVMYNFLGILKCCLRTSLENIVFDNNQYEEVLQNLLPHYEAIDTNGNNITWKEKGKQFISYYNIDMTKNKYTNFKEVMDTCIKNSIKKSASMSQTGIHSKSVIMKPGSFVVISADRTERTKYDDTDESFDDIPIPFPIVTTYNDQTYALQAVYIIGKAHQPKARSQQNITLNTIDGFEIIMFGKKDRTVAEFGKSYMNAQQNGIFFVYRVAHNK